jgi:hypothetical protein
VPLFFSAETEIETNGFVSPELCAARSACSRVERESPCTVLEWMFT